MTTRSHLTCHSPVFFLPLPRLLLSPLCLQSRCSWIPCYSSKERYFYLLKVFSLEPSFARWCNHVCFPNTYFAQNPLFVPGEIYKLSDYPIYCCNQSFLLYFPSSLAFPMPCGLALPFYLFQRHLPPYILQFPFSIFLIFIVCVHPIDSRPQEGKIFVQITYALRT